ncbi:hypothetical protein E4U54_004704, partial [Claviceps lovelessii]
MAPQTAKQKRTEPEARQRRPVPGVSRGDSDDELGSDDLPWEWIYDVENPERASDGTQNDRKRRKVTSNKIAGARIGSFECRVGDTVLLKAEGSNEAWVAIICEFIDDEGEGEKAANFMWFSTEKEIRNKERKRSDFHWVNELYISPSWDINPLASINGKAKVSSLESFLSAYPSGKIARNSTDYGKTFICRRGCNTRTATYTDEFVWEDLYTGPDDLFRLIDLVEKGTKAVRARRKTREQSPQDTAYLPPQTPTKGARSAVTTPQSKRGHADPGSRTQRRQVCLR